MKIILDGMGGDNAPASVVEGAVLASKELEEASVLQDIAHMPARVKCAVLGWHTMQELLKTEEK